MRARAYTSQRLRREGWVGRPATPAAARGLAAARAALAGEGPTLSGPEAVAECERLRMEDEARRAVQRCLLLRLPTA